MAGKLRRLAELGSLGAGATRAWLKRATPGEQARDLARSLGRMRGVAQKAGQQLALLASHLDLPEDVQQALGSLHAGGETVPFERVRAAVEQELGGRLDDHFVAFDPHPLGTASLAQAHAARTRDGRAVVVKVLHDGVEEALEADLLAIRAFLRTGRVVGGRDPGEVRDVLDEVEARLREELDYLHEAANIEVFAAAFAGDPRVRLPRTVPALCTERVLTMDRVAGVDVDTFTSRASDEVRQQSGTWLAELFFESVFRHRLLHADPHPGNYLFDDDGTIGLVDFGCTKRFDEFFLGAYGRALLAALDDDRSAALEACRALGCWTGDDRAAGEALWRFLDTLVAPWRHGESTIGHGEPDLLVRMRPAAEALWRYPEVRGSRDMLFLHRALGGMYGMARKVRVRGDWGALLRLHLGHAVAVAEGQVTSASDPPPRAPRR